jgi:hemerythrin superfamily protein
MDIYALIHNDHVKAKDVMQKIKALSDGEHEKRLKMFYPLMVDLLTHNEAEEETFYVALKEHSKTKKDAKHSEHEHHEAADMLEDLDDDEIEPDEWRMKFDEMCKAVLHHITKEEGEVFREAKEVLSDKTAALLATEMTKLKKQKKPLAQHELEEKRASHRA